MLSFVDKQQWTGDFSDKSDKWTNRLKGLVNYKDADDGAFWMEFTDFCLQFEVRARALVDCEIGCSASARVVAVDALALAGCVLRGAPPA